MKKPVRKYTDKQIDLLSGLIKGGPYLPEVKAELEKTGHTYSDGHIYRVIHGVRHTDVIWDAVRAVLAKRKQTQKEIDADLAELAA
ncbi:hypothetical protein GGR92_000029 [Spirosoma lacussanchae]|uniref:hypothetical protein n=1 Tax=Spirosoma lacussanchae TaxID=1884249 RepID=UPI0011093AAA|nr:hypothetical protein [Spirosoma lacussanchae]